MARVSAPQKVKPTKPKNDKPKGTHGGARERAGRPRNDAKLQILGTTSAPSTPPRRRRTPLSSPPRRAQASNSTATTSARPSAFFLPVNTHRPVPLGNLSASGPPGQRPSFWSNLAASHSKFAQSWNELVDGQSRVVTDSNQCLYYKLSQHLEVHHKKTILWSMERSTLANGSNFAACKPLLDILNSAENYFDVLPAILLPDAAPDGELNSSIAGLNDPTSFNPMAEKPAQDEQPDSVFTEWETTAVPINILPTDQPNLSMAINPFQVTQPAVIV
ncbi:hypothetical protein C8R44DRAFT_872348 [Mycena epipterygia]|nr:hypothetical protein C8R44DRAFT_872348 [Mycena epipterygia]